MKTSLFKSKAHNRICITAVLFLCFSYLNIYGQVLTKLGDIEVNLDELSYSKFTVISPKKNIIAVNQVDSVAYSVIGSQGAEYIAVVNEYSSYYYDYYGTNSKMPGTKLSLYNSQGELMFSKDYGKYTIISVNLEPDGNFVHVNYLLIDEFDMASDHKMQTLNSKGEVLLELQKASLPIQSPLKNGVIYYTQTRPETKGEQSLVCFNLNTGSIEWSKTFLAERLRILDIAKNTDNLILLKNDMLLCLNGDGDIKFEKPVSTRPGLFDISDDGRYILNIVNSMNAVLYDIEKKIQIKSFNSLNTSMGEIKFFVLGGFVEGTENTLFFNYFFDEKNYIGFFDIEGGLIDGDTFEANDINFPNKLKVVKSNSLYSIYVDGYLVNRIISYQ